MLISVTVKPPEEPKFEPYYYPFNKSDWKKTYYKLKRRLPKFYVEPSPIPDYIEEEKAEIRKALFDNIYLDKKPNTYTTAEYLFEQLKFNLWGRTAFPIKFDLQDLINRKRDRFKKPKIERERFRPIKQLKWLKEFFRGLGICGNCGNV